MDPQFSVVSEETNDRPSARGGARRTAIPTAAERAMLGMIASAFSERTLAIFSALFLVGGLLSALYVWWLFMANPSELRLIGAIAFSAFVLLLEWVRKSRHKME